MIAASPLYKKMCEKAELLQSKWKSPNIQIIYYIPKGDYGGTVDETQLKCIKKPDEWKNNYTWIPTEADLTKIIGSESQASLVRLYELFGEECISKISSLRKRAETSVVLTLKFVMAMYGHLWDEKEEKWKT